MVPSEGAMLSSTCQQFNVLGLHPLRHRAWQDVRRSFEQADSCAERWLYYLCSYGLSSGIAL